MEKSTNRQTGTTGEAVAAVYLQEKGYQIIAKNWRTKIGEINIIAYKDSTIVFVEVKTWPHGDYFSLAAAINKRKRKRIIETAKCFLSDYRQYKESYVRFDVIAIGMQQQEKIYHIENAFLETL